MDSEHRGRPSRQQQQPRTQHNHGISPFPTQSDGETSIDQHIQFEEQPLVADHQYADGGDGEWHGRSRRRSSAANRLAGLTDFGGVNSIRSFTRSWQRAAGFTEVIPQRPSFVFAPGQEPIAPGESLTYGRSEISVGERTSLLRGHLGIDTVSENALSDGDDDELDPAENRWNRPKFGDELSRVISPSGSLASNSNSIFEVQPHLASPPLVGSYASYRTYGTIEPDIERPSMIHAAETWRTEQESGAELARRDRPPILVKEVEQEDGKIVLAVSGQSTLPQTIVNSTNVLIGIGLLSLPIGLRYAGWICGIIMLFACAAVTSWTARLLAKCMDVDPSMITFSDIAYVSFGRKARVITSVVFMMELLAANVALVVLFADSLVLLFPGLISVTAWKIFCVLLVLPLQFAPLRVLSFTSFVGILSVFSIVVIVVLDGLIKPDSPGSLLEPATTYLFPKNWLTLPLSFGLLMSPWGGHGVFPNIYRDMRHPHKYKEAVGITFSFTLLIDTSIAIIGLIMFGDEVRDEVTSNILTTKGYPQALSILMVIFIAIIPLTKIPLNAQPMIVTAEVVFGVRQQSAAAARDGDDTLTSRSRMIHSLARIMVRALLMFIFLLIAIAFPAFDSIMAFMGSALCFTICVTLPLAFYLKLFGSEIKTRERIFCWFVMMTSLIISIIGTVWAFLPKRLLDA